jgi:dTDP-4-dehydrorhamnose 3,5-epimerase
MIDGVKVKRLRVNSDERGNLMEILRNDDPEFSGFGQAYITTCYPGVVKGWHCHQFQNDFFCGLQGMTKVVLYDGRPDSPTHGEVNEFFIGPHNPICVVIPMMVMHGFKGIDVGPSMVLNIPNMPYNRQEPDELRLPFDTPEIPYDWGIKMG